MTQRPRLSAGVPRQAGWSSSNWSGYAKTGTFTKATGQWIVPGAARSKGSTYSSAWVGIDGFKSSLIQTGTESDYYGGSAHYAAWWEILPAAETVIPSTTVHPGDHMSASITKGSGNSWTITLTDTTTGKSFTTTQNYTGPGSSVEWVEEAPSIGGHVATLVQYSSPDTFDPGTANGGNPGLDGRRWRRDGPEAQAGVDAVIARQRYGRLQHVVREHCAGAAVVVEGR